MLYSLTYLVYYVTVSIERERETELIIDYASHVAYVTLQRKIYDLRFLFNIYFSRVRTIFILKKISAHLSAQLGPRRACASIWAIGGRCSGGG